MQVNFYKFTKKENSTKTATGTATTYNVNLIRGSGIIRPRIELNYGLTAAPDFNYVTIPSWGRSYYITEWEFSPPLWIGTLFVDVLASYKETIGDTNLYALRASNSWTGAIIDTLYPTYTNWTYSETLIVNPWRVQGGGSFVLGIVSNDPHFGSLNYYAMDGSNMRKVINWLLDDAIIAEHGFDLQDASFALQKSLIDPLQYIKSAIFIPLPIGDIAGEVQTTLQVFDWTVENVNVKQVSTNEPYENGTRRVAIPKHPQADARGAFLNCAPYTTYTLDFPPLGIIQIDGSAFINDSHMNIGYAVDLPTGAGCITVERTTGYVVNRIQTQIGVPIQLSQITRDYIGVGLAAIDTAAAWSSSFGSMLTGNIFGGAGQMASATAHGLADGLAAMTPRQNSIGSGGGYYQLYTQPKLMAQFAQLVPDDIEHNGRPLCQIIKPKTYGGYFLIQDGDVAIAGTKEEAQLIKNYLETGFYYE